MKTTRTWEQLIAAANERVDCGRCGGLGQWCGGPCFRCHGTRKRLTRAARAARIIADKVVALRKRIAELEANNDCPNCRDDAEYYERQLEQLIAA